MKSEVECDIQYVQLWSDRANRDIPGVRAYCSRCGHSTESFGQSAASVKRCLALMREGCPTGGDHFYVEGSTLDEEDVRAQGLAEPTPPAKSPEDAFAAVAQAALAEAEAAAPKTISSFNGSYGFLSNFYSCTVPYDGYVYPSAEHAYQAAKVGGSECEIVVFRQEIREAETPKLAKSLGQQVTLREGWEEIKVGVMTQIVLLKFAVHPDLRRQLLATGDARLIEGNSWGDKFWGAQAEMGGGFAVEWVGKNILGKILMGVRERLG